MRRGLLHIKLLLLTVAAILSASCDSLIDMNDTEICDYTVRLRYDYNRENTSAVNLIESYVTSIDEYIFDEAGYLLAVNTVGPDPCGEGMISDLDLLPGRYSVIAVGNKDTRSAISDAGAPLVPGTTHRDDVIMDLKNAVQNADGTRGPSERLFHGYRTFSVEMGKTSNIRVDMVHSHMVLQIRVTWRVSAPVGESDVTLTLGRITPRYSLMPEFAFINYASKTHDPMTDDKYPVSDNSVIHHIPRVRTDILPRDTYRVDSYINANKAVNAEFVSYRVRKTDDLTVTLTGSNGSLMSDVDLAQWFADNHIELDLNLRQEFALEFIIDTDGSVVINALDIMDWFEGGQIN